MELVGTQFKLCDNWFYFLPPESYSNRPVNYLEIGAYYGHNLISVATTYCQHPESKMYAIDPWLNYDDYPEYKGVDMPNIFEGFKKNVETHIPPEKLNVYQNFSHKVLPYLEDEFFDLIFIDGNHEPDYVLEDGVLSFRKLKKGGVLILDDYDFQGHDYTKRGIDCFMSAYRDKFKYIGFYQGQMMIQKL